ncbi:patatin-like phospholipase family protein [Vallicoccus soli]|uniref:patatin-like phospholipase family protein n=1 Tax=Vallicoccus soli TaxID=2339232 RepID=UPI001402A336|nr:patatin-like phospholipase family protein [Vallicoccus soli]
MSTADARPAGRTLLVLGGGGALGAYQAGAVRALLRAGVVPDALYGCSAGALNGAFLAAEPTPERAAALTGWWSDPRTRAVLAPTGWARLRGATALLTTRGLALHDARPLRRLVAEHVPGGDLAALPVPLVVTTTCLDCGAAEHHAAGPVDDVLAASCALPGLFGPVRLGDGHLHVDGGVVCGVPVERALADAGPDDRVLVLDCGLAPVTGRPGACAADPTPRELAEEACGLPLGPSRGAYVPPVETARGLVEVVLRSFTVARAVANRAAVAAALGDPRVHVLPHVADAWAAGLLERLPAGPRDLGATAALVDAGAAAATAWLGASSGSAVPA